jgi:hypothetical protein
VSKYARLAASCVLRIFSLDGKASLDYVRDVLGMFFGPHSSDCVSDLA